MCFLTTEELAARWKFSVEQVREKARQKIIPAFRIPGSRQWRFDLEVIEAIESGTFEARSLKTKSKIEKYARRPIRNTNEKESLWL